MGCNKVLTVARKLPGATWCKATKENGYQCRQQLGGLGSLAKHCNNASVGRRLFRGMTTLAARKCLFQVQAAKQGMQHCKPTLLLLLPACRKPCRPMKKLRGS